ncbi:hypothetical protein V6N13_103497 [Hibiscus sabdariffa]
MKSGYRLLQMESRANIGEAAISPMLSHFFSEGINFVDQPLASVWKDWLARTFLGLSLAHKRALIVTFSAVWYARNKLESEMNLVRASLGPAIHHAKWFAPPVDVIKVNFDSAFSLQTRQSISGVMCRDSEGVESIPIMNKSLRLVSEFRTTASSRLLVDTKQQQHRCSLVQWRLPARDWLKVNIYASRCSVSGYATSGGVVRDSGGT